MHLGVPATRAVIASLAAIAIAAALVSGGSGADPRTPPALPGKPAPFLGIAVLGDGGATAAVDAYGDLVDLRPSPAGPALLAVSSARQAAGSVPAGSALVPRLSVGGGPASPPWRAEGVTQRYLPSTDTLRTVARFGRARLRVTQAAAGSELAIVARARGPAGLPMTPALAWKLAPTAGCRRESGHRVVALVCEPGTGESGDGPGRASGMGSRGDMKRPAHRAGAILRRAQATIVRAGIDSRRWLRRARPLGRHAPGWARRLYERSLLVLRALAGRSGAVAAGARDGWAYVWPRDAGAVAIALRAAGYRQAAGRISRFLLGLDLGAAARFGGNGDPVPGRGPQGDAAGWVAAAAIATDAKAAHDLDPGAARGPAQAGGYGWRGMADYWEGAPGAYLANAIAASPIPTHVSEFSPRQRRESSDTLEKEFATPRGLVRRAGEPGSGLDSAAAWAVRPFARPALYAKARETMLRLARRADRFGITPGEGWEGSDPWSAPTAWTAWSLAALAASERPPAARADRSASLRLLAELRRAATPLDTLPERVDAGSGIARSTTPLAWSHAFAILALRQLWPGGASDASAAACCGSAGGASRARR